jgi:hypothetical protein
LNEFLSDTQEIGQGVVVGQGNWQDILDNNKQAFTGEFVQRTRFTSAFPGSLTPAQFVDMLNANAGNPLAPAERDQLVTDLSSGARTRAQVLRGIAEHPNVVSGESNRAFVLMQYFGYLRRNPNDQPDADYTGYDFWLTKLNQFGGNYINSEMIKAFITSLEYRSRFGPSGTPTPTPTPTLGAGLTAAQRIAALESVKQKWVTLDTGADPQTVNQQLLDFIRNRPEFSEADISKACVWAKFTDGVELTVVNNEFSSDAAIPRSTRTSFSPDQVPLNLPDSIKARLVFGFGPSFSNPIADIRSWLNEENYTQPINEGATVDLLKTVGGDGVLYFRGHGGTAKGTEPYALSTVTEVSEALDKTYDADLKPINVNGQDRVRLRYMLTRYDLNGTGDDSKKLTYGFTSQFVRDYWGNFSANSFIFIDACESSAAEASGFQSAISEKKGSVYAGWNSEVHQSMQFNTAEFVFDRLLGGNHVYPESDGYKIRPFNFSSVAQDFVSHGVGTDPTGAQLTFVPLTVSSTTEGFQALAPSIEDMAMDEQTGVLVINGEFGEDPGENSRAVYVGGMQAHCQWSSGLISCDLPSSGAGSAGEVIVTVRQQKSNTAYLSLWQGTFTHTVLENNTLKEVDTYNLTLRADTRKVRFEIHKPPTFYRFGIESPRIVMATDTSLMGYECSGTFTAGDCTTIWSGSGTVPRIQTNPLKQGFEVAGGLYDNGVLLLSFSPLSKGRIVDTVCQNSPPSHDNLDLFSVVVGPADGGSNPIFSLDASGNIKGNKLTFTDGIDAHTFQWGLISIQFPPSPDSPR